MQNIFSGKSSWFFLTLILLVPLLVHSYDGGTPIGGVISQPPVGYTRAGGEPDCTLCHTGTLLNGGGGQMTVAVSSSSGPVLAYASGATYQVTVTISDKAQKKWGFELSARTVKYQQSGAIAIGSDGYTQLLKSFNGVQYIAHTFKGTRDGTKNGVTFTFSWTAPDISTGEADFWAVGNAANGDLSPDNDHIYSFVLRLLPQPPPPPPVIATGGTVNNASFTPGTTALAAGSIVAIFGANLDDGSLNPFPIVGPDGKIATTLGSASVTFNGVPAPMFASSPGQIDAQIPYELTGITSASVVVTVEGQPSSPQTVPFGPFSPGIFTFASTGQGQGTVQIANTALVAAAAGSIPGVSSRPATPGDVLTIYCTGLGDVTNRPPTGALSPSNPLAATIAPVLVTIGGVPAVGFSGLAPGFAGLYQVNAQVPPGVPAGSAVPLFVSVGGVQSNTVSIAVASSP